MAINAARMTPTRARRVYARAIVWARRVSPVRAAAFAPVRCRKRAFLRQNLRQRTKNVELSMLCWRVRRVTNPRRFVWAVFPPALWLIFVCVVHRPTGYTRAHGCAGVPPPGVGVGYKHQAPSQTAPYRLIFAANTSPQKPNNIKWQLTPNRHFAD